MSRPRLSQRRIIAQTIWRGLSGAVGREWALALLLVMVDTVVWITVYHIALFVRGAQTGEEPLQVFLLGALELAIAVGALFVIGGYDRKVEKRSLSYTAEHILAVIAAGILSAMVVYSAATFDQTMKPSRAVLLMSFVVFCPISLFYRRWLGRYVAATIAERAFLVVGSGPAAARFYEAYRESPNRQQLHFVALHEERVGQPIAGAGSPVVEGNLAGKLQQLSSHYSGIILAESAKLLSGELLDKLVRTQFQQTRVYTLESFYETHWRYVPLEVIDPVWPLQTGFQLSRMSPYHYLKRLFDMTAAVLGLVICAPILGLVAVLIWLEGKRKASDSFPARGGKVIFQQQRVGRTGALFTIHKFRTMTMRPTNEDDDIYTRKGDPRVTRLGGWLRRLRLDELPQLWNVLKGDMSLIGPRAEWIKCAERYERSIPFYHFRHLVKPGITGWAQVNYPYGESDKDALEKLRYDLYYIRHYSLKLDAMIILKTVHTMLFSRGR